MKETCEGFWRLFERPRAVQKPDRIVTGPFAAVCDRAGRSFWNQFLAVSNTGAVQKSNPAFNREAIERALEEKVFRIKLAVDEVSDTSGGLAVYGRQNFGRYPLGPTLIIRMK